VRDAKIRILSSLKRNSEEERKAWNDFAAKLKEEFPDYTPLLAKILEGLLSGGSDEDKIHLNHEIINAANDVIESIDKDELARWISIKHDPEDEEAETVKKKMETTHDQLTEALYRKGLALAEVDSVKAEQVPAEESSAIPSGQADQFEENFKELKKWVDIKSPKYCMLLMVRERRNGRLGMALKVLNEMIQDDSEPPKKKLYDLKIELLDQIGWSHVASYERRWMHVRFPPSLPVF